MPSLNDIEHLTEDFTKQILGETDYKEMCYTVCYPLQIYLEIKQIKCSLEGGQYQLYPATEGLRDHFWLSLLDYPGMVVDPTVKQFGPNALKGNVFPITSSYLPHQDIDWPSIQKAWCSPLINQSTTGVDIRKYVPVNLKAAEFVLSRKEIENQTQEWWNGHGTYLKAIEQIFLIYQGQMGIDCKQYPKVSELLL
ncbi:hypothetical protein [Pedobacter sp.]